MSSKKPSSYPPDPEPPSNTAKDAVDLLLAQSRRQFPDSNFTILGITKRILRIAHILEREQEAALAALRIDLGEFDVLATLLRAGPPYALNPTQLLKSCAITSGGITSRVNRLERANLVHRVSDQDDRRRVLVVLTPHGDSVTRDALKRLSQLQDRMLGELPTPQAEQLISLLRGVLLAVEASASEPVLRSHHVDITNS